VPSEPQPEGITEIGDNEGVIARFLILLLLLLALSAACGGDGDPSATDRPQAPQKPTLTAEPSESPDENGLGTWQTLAPMPTPRTEVAVAALHGLIYVIGGFEADGSPSAKVEVYNPATDTWSEAAPLPEARHHAAAVELGRRIFLIGGFATSFSDPQAGVWSYDPTDDSWSEEPPMNVARGAHAAVGSRGSVFVVGGVGVAATNLASIEMMNTRPISWDVSAHSFSLPRDHLAVAAVEASAGGDLLETLIYVVGGRLNLDYAQNVDRLESLHGSGALNVLLPAMPTARSGLAAAALEGRIYVFGGESPEGTFDENEAYDPASDTWKTMAPMPTARHGLGAAVVGDTIYVIGGGPEPGLSVTGANEAYTPPR